jgi:hypothetical protein
MGGRFPNKIRRRKKKKFVIEREALRKCEGRPERKLFCAEVTEGANETTKIETVLRAESIFFLSRGGDEPIGNQDYGRANDLRRFLLFLGGASV